MTNLLLQSENDVIRVLHSIFAANDIQYISHIDEDEVITRLRQAIQVYKSNGMAESCIAIAKINLDLMKITDNTLNTTKFAKFLVEKHRRYGASPIIEVGHEGIALRMISKLGRFTNMRDIADNTQADEEDTLQDILGYCILGIKLAESMKK